MGKRGGQPGENRGKLCPARQRTLPCSLPLRCLGPRAAGDPPPSRAAPHLQRRDQLPQGEVRDGVAPRLPARGALLLADERPLEAAVAEGVPAHPHADGVLHDLPAKRAAELLVRGLRVLQGLVGTDGHAEPRRRAGVHGLVLGFAQRTVRSGFGLLLSVGLRGGGRVGAHLGAGAAAAAAAARGAARGGAAAALRRRRSGRTTVDDAVADHRDGGHGRGRDHVRTAAAAGGADRRRTPDRVEATHGRWASRLVPVLGLHRQCVAVVLRVLPFLVVGGRGVAEGRVGALGADGTHNGRVQMNGGTGPLGLDLTDLVLQQIDL